MNTTGGDGKRRRGRTAALALAVLAAFVAAQTTDPGAAATGSGVSEDPPPRGDDPGPRALRAEIDLACATWTANGQPHDGVRSDPGPPALVHLPIDAQGLRWATIFSTEAAATFRLYLRWQPAADGLLFEVVLDGERLAPPRDGWRPSPRDLLTDLGPRWLGHGTHRLEFVAREDPGGPAALHLASLQLRDP